MVVNLRRLQTIKYYKFMMDRKHLVFLIIYNKFLYDKLELKH